MTNPRAALSFLARALVAARTNAAWPPLRVYADLLEATSPERAGALAPPAVVDGASGLPPYELWARLRADQTVAREEAAASAAHLEPLAALEARAAASPVHAQRLVRRRTHDALRALPLVRLAELDVATRAALPKGGRRVLAMLDKVEVGGVIVRLAAELSVDKSVTDRALFEVLFAQASAPVERTLDALSAARGVLDVERVSRGAVEHCAVADAGVCPAPFDALDETAGAALCSFGYATAARDVTAGDNDVLRPPAPAPPASPLHRVFRDRKLVATRAARPFADALVRTAGTRTLIYDVASEARV